MKKKLSNKFLSQYANCKVKILFQPIPSQKNSAENRKFWPFITLDMYVRFSFYHFWIPFSKNIVSYTGTLGWNFCHFRDPCPDMTGKSGDSPEKIMFLCLFFTWTFIARFEESSRQFFALFTLKDILFKVECVFEWIFPH